MKKNQTGDLTLQEIQAILEKLGGYSGAIRFLEGETVIVNKKNISLQKQDGIIRLPPIWTDGTNGNGWIKRLEERGMDFVLGASGVLVDKNVFTFTSGLKVMPVILTGEIFSDALVTVHKVRWEAKNRGFLSPSIEIVGYIAEWHTAERAKQFNITKLVVMHEPFGYNGRQNRILYSDHEGSRRHVLAMSCSGATHDVWNNDKIGFVFLEAVAQKGGEGE